MNRRCRWPGGSDGGVGGVGRLAAGVVLDVLDRAVLEVGLEPLGASSVVEDDEDDDEEGEDEDRGDDADGLEFEKKSCI